MMAPLLRFSCLSAVSLAIVSPRYAIARLGEVVIVVLLVMEVLRFLDTIVNRQRQISECGYN